MHETVLLLTFMRVQRMWIDTKRQDTVLHDLFVYVGEAHDRHEVNCRRQFGELYGFCPTFYFIKCGLPLMKST